MRLTRRLRTLAALGLLPLAGCTESGPPLHAVNGRVAGDVAQLAGHSVELTLKADRTVRAAGTIQPDGRFQVESLQAGHLRRGTPPGEYEARLVIVDEGDGQAKKPKVPPRFLRSETSGWSVRVPPPGDVTLTLPPK